MAGAGEAVPVGPGTEIDGFVIEAVAGRGGMGVVYRARQRQPDRAVALKVIATGLADNPEFRARFQRESAIAAQIEHPSVIPVYAVGEADGVLYLAMRFVDGVDLRTLLAQQRCLDPRRAATIVDQVAQALDAAHAHGLVHRDVKPANVLISTAGGRDHVYLSDFGLSRHVEGSQGLTGTGSFLGTIDYVAPEQALGERVDARTDVYSLGCLLFHALTGTVPFPLDNDLAKLYAHGSQPPPSPLERAPDLPAAFEPLLARAMAKAPDDRYLSAGDLGRAAVAAAAGGSLSRAERSVAAGGAAPQEVGAVPARPAPTQTPEGKTTQPAAAPASAERREVAGGGAAASVRRRRTLVAGGIALLVLVAVAAGVAITGGGGDDKPAPAAGTKPEPAAATVGIDPGHSIGPISLGEKRDDVRRELEGNGYTRKPGEVASEDVFSSDGDGNMIVEFDNDTANFIQKFNDPTIKVKGVSIESTPREAQEALPDWTRVPCNGKVARLVSPDGHTYFELPTNPDQDNSKGFNGIIVGASPVDRSSCT
jgi:hypothetical protein